MTRPKIGPDGGKATHGTRVLARRKTVAEVIKAREKELLETWLGNIRTLAGTRTLELMTEGQFRKQLTDLLRALRIAFSAERYEDIDRPEFADLVAMLRDISASRAEQGFTPTETAIFILSFKDALLEYLQAEFSGDPALLIAEISKMNKVIDKLALVTFETFVWAREDIIAHQREEIIERQKHLIMELSTPVIRIWNEVVLMPLIGVIDTARTQQMMERLLESIVQTEARAAILDVSGVPVIDASVAKHLLNTVTAAKMLGAQVIVTGISPDAAQAMAKLRIELAALRACGSLRAGVVEALRMTGKQITSL